MMALTNFGNAVFRCGHHAARQGGVLVMCWLIVASVGTAADRLELLSGVQLDGKVTAIRKEAKEFDFEATIAGKAIRKTYRFDEVHAVTLQGKRHVLTPLPDPDPGSSTVPQRSIAEVRQIIQRAGQELPSWWNEVPLDYPQTLDLSWPLKPQGAWNNQRNVGQYIWDIIHPNPDRWQSGIKLVHHIADMHQQEPALLKRDWETLGRMYFELLRDYPRAAYWLERAGVTGRQPMGIKLAECYYRLGNRTMAEKMLQEPALPLVAIKLLGELGQTDRALRLAQAFQGTQAENDARLLAADLLHSLGRQDEAIREYEKVIRSDKFRNEEYRQRTVQRAAESIAAIRLAEKAKVDRVADGVYSASSTGYNGPVHVELEVRGGKLTRVEVTRHREKQFYSAIEDTTDQIRRRQSVQGIDGFSGATITSKAIVNAAAQALAQGAR
ncbi:MAG: FMN-binding protein [Planctomycetota bacterium]|nr:MAG: FMN-binding protein [Planctomycetota bacterium]